MGLKTCGFAMGGWVEGGLYELFSLGNCFLCWFRLLDSNNLVPADWKPEVLEASWEKQSGVHWLSWCLQMEPLMHETMLLPASGLPSRDQPLVFCQEGGGVTWPWRQGRGCCAQHLTVSHLQPILPGVARPPAPPRVPGDTCFWAFQLYSCSPALLGFLSCRFQIPFLFG